MSGRSTICGSLGWIAALIFAICAALRLARFNVALDDAGRPEWQAKYLRRRSGARRRDDRAPAVLSRVQVGVPHGLLTAPIVLVYTRRDRLLMVSRLPTWSGKLVGKRIPRDMVLPIFVLVVIYVALLLELTPSRRWRSAR